MAWGWRRMGRGRGAWTGPWPGRGPFSYLPPWQRPGWLFRGFGRGWWRWGYGYPYNPWTCARFPWLPRWWWANPAYTHSFMHPYTAYPWTGYGYGYGYGYPSMPYTLHPYWYW